MSLILIIEDSQIMGEAASEALAAAGYETMSCLTVADGLSNCQERRPDLVVTEYYINDGTGLDLLTKLARLEYAPPVIMVTGCGREDVAAKALSLGAWGYRLKTEEYLAQLPALAAECLRDQAAKKVLEEKERLRRRLDAQNELSGWLAHNFKNILAASIGYLNLIDFKNSNQSRDKQAEYLSDSRRSQENAISLLGRLSLMTEAEGGEAEPVITAEVVDEAWERARAKIIQAADENSPDQLERVKEKMGRVLFLNSARRLEPVNMVRADLSSILESLLQNALEAVLPVDSPRILVLGEANGGNLEITIKDNGRGMSENVLKHAPEPLFSTKGEVGVGLGLSLASSLVMRHGGDLSLKSSQGAGATVKITLPISR